MPQIDTRVYRKVFEVAYSTGQYSIRTVLDRTHDSLWRDMLRSTRVGFRIQTIIYLPHKCAEFRSVRQLKYGI